MIAVANTLPVALRVPALIQPEVATILPLAVIDEPLKAPLLARYIGLADPETWNSNPLVGSTLIVLPSKSNVAAVRYPVFQRAVGLPKL